MDPTRKNGQGSRPTCLIVENDAPVRTALREWLTGVFPGCHFSGVGSGEEAMWLINFQTPNVILMAIGLPGMSGLQATRRIKRVLPDVKVVILTRYDTREYRAEAGAAQADAYVLKHTMDTELIPLLTRLLPG